MKRNSSKFSILFFIFCLTFKLNTYSKEKLTVTFGGSEMYPWQIFKYNGDKSGIFQLILDKMLENTNYKVQWVEMTNLIQQKELTKKNLILQSNRSF